MISDLERAELRQRLINLLIAEGVLTAAFMIDRLVAIVELYL